MQIMRALVVALTLAMASPLAPGLSQPVQAQTGLIDINAATKPELEALKGIGPVRAEAIVKGRPYKGKDELVSRKIIPESVYKDIKDKIIAKQKQKKS